MLKNKPDSFYYLLIGFFSVLLYCTTFNHGFVYDDGIVILLNSYVRDGISGISNIWTHSYLFGSEGYNDGLYRPLSPTVFAFLYQLFGKNPFPFHVVNVLIYALIGMLIFKFGKLISSNNTAFGLVISLLYILHPIHTEVVANNKSLDELLTMLFGMLAIIEVVKPEEITVKKIAVVTCYFALSLFSKESAVSLLVVIPFAYWFFHKNSSGKIWFLTGILAVTTLLWFELHSYIISSMPNKVNKSLFSGLCNAVIMADSVLDKLSTGVWITFLYFFKCLLPISLSADYSPNAIPVIPFFSLKSFLSAIMLSGLVILGFIGMKSRKLYAFGILLFFVFIAPVSNIFIHIGTSFGERLAFMPSLGIVICGGWLFESVHFNKKIYLLGGICVLFSFVAINRSLYWKSDLILFEKDVNTEPLSFRLHYNFATELMETVENKSGDQLTGLDKKNIQKAIEEFNKTIEIRPDFSPGYNNLGNAYEKLGDTEKAVETHKSLLKKDPYYDKSLFNLGLLYVNAGNFKEAHFYFIENVSHNNYKKAISYNHAGVCSGHLGNYDTAKIEFLKSIELDSINWETWNNLAVIYFSTSDFKSALVALEKANSIASNPQIIENIRICKENLKEKF